MRHDKALMDLRIYPIRPRGTAACPGLFDAPAMPVRRRHIGPPLARFVGEHGPLDRLAHLRARHSLAGMEARRAARNADPDRATCRNASAHPVVARGNRIRRRAGLPSPRQGRA
ncbi:hypothetical protein GCM10010964_37430 [Caldovatus sediminis]|uniref:NIPSNAP domain-containing protein n=1 Tax=Caldovatus sediminis TaxID=2041189 RepID=A0A8J3EDQ0_9PROT|nr:NIPSNAP family protein [Caldovatus sediminis]GGG46588.1 hypothetical protein GCM10010964_37430 [Caldovatus sediminis]